MEARKLTDQERALLIAHGAAICSETGCDEEHGRTIEGVMVCPFWATTQNFMRVLDAEDSNSEEAWGLIDMYHMLKAAGIIHETAARMRESTDE